MFSSEQHFVINGEYDSMLEKVIDLALNLSDTKNIKSFYKDEKGLVLCSFEWDGSTSYPFVPTTKVLVEQIKQYISNLTDVEIFALAGPEPGVDGEVVLGWEVFCPLWYGDNKIEKYHWSAIIAVRPSWIIYAK